MSFAFVMLLSLSAPNITITIAVVVAVVVELEVVKDQVSQMRFFGVHEINTIVSYTYIIRECSHVHLCDASQNVQNLQIAEMFVAANLLERAHSHKHRFGESVPIRFTFGFNGTCVSKDSEIVTEMNEKTQREREKQNHTAMF